jgi:hypothetical protein
VPPDPAGAGWIATVDDPSTTQELIPSDATVSPVRAGADVLRVEVVADSPEPVFVSITTDGRLAEDAPDGGTPLVREVHLSPDTTSLVVSVSRGTDSGASVQCRIYDGPTLVAVQTGSDTVLCTAKWSQLPLP